MLKTGIFLQSRPASATTRPIVAPMQHDIQNDVQKFAFLLRALRALRHHNLDPTARGADGSRELWQTRDAIAPGTTTPFEGESECRKN
jgi:hypothetical protein